MELSHLGIALVTFILAITLHQTNELIKNHSQNQSVFSVTFDHSSSSTSQYSADYNHKFEYNLKTLNHSQEYPCRYF